MIKLKERSKRALVFRDFGKCILGVKIVIFRPHTLQIGEENHDLCFFPNFAKIPLCSPLPAHSPYSLSHHKRYHKR